MIGAWLLLAGCGTQQAPGTGGPGGASGTNTTASGPVRPLTDQKVAADGALECPGSVPEAQGQSVPVWPQGVDGLARLLPDREPASMVVCAYPVLTMDMNPVQPTAPYAVRTRHVVPRAGMSAAVEQLAWAPRSVDGSQRACTAMGGAVTNYLLGVRYSDAVVWVASQHEPNSCTGSGNGDFVSNANVGQLLAGLAGAVTDRPEPSVPGCDTWSQGRLGDDVTLVPDGSPTVIACRPTNAGVAQETKLDAAQAAAVVQQLRGLETASTSHGCSSTEESRMNRDLRLVLAYPEGPPVVLNVVASCEPMVVFGGNLQADLPAQLLDLLEKVSPPVADYDPNRPVTSDGTAATEAPTATGTVTPGSPPSTGTVPPVLPQPSGTPRLDFPPTMPDVRITTPPPVR